METEVNKMEQEAANESGTENVTQNQNQKQESEKRVLCCTARTWSVWIGWIELISNGIGLGFAIFVCVLMLSASDIETPENPNSNVVPAQTTLGISVPILILSFIRCTIGIFAGILLLVAVKLEDPIKLRLWIGIEVVCLVLIALAVLHSFVRVGKSTDSIIEFIVFLISAFSICVVNVHRNELKKMLAKEQDGNESENANQIEDLDKSLNLDKILFEKESQHCKSLFHNAARLNRKMSLK